MVRIPREILPPRDQPIVAAVSGGPDSLCLLGALLNMGYRPIVAHVDHGLRPESGSEARQVEELTQSLGLEFSLSRAPVSEYAAERRLSVEEAARTLRYAALANAALTHGAAHIALGHTADDQAETILMHFLRGSGLAGLAGMAWSTPLAALRLPDLPQGSEGITLIRPLLGLSRIETEAYCVERGWTPVRDPSNADTTLYRNRFRHELLPLLETYNPRIRQVLSRTGEVLRADHQASQAEVDRAWRGAEVRLESGAVYLNRSKLLALPLAYRRGLLRRAIERLRPALRDIGFESVERALDFLARPPATRQADLASGLCLRFQGDEVLVCEWEYAPVVEDFPQLAGPVPLPLPAGSASFGSAWQVQTETQDLSPGLRERIEENRDPWKAFFDAKLAGDRLCLRSRRPGDRLQPLGMLEGSLKVSDLMINLKVPSVARERWPLLANDREVMWAAGLRVHHAYRVTESTARVLEVSFHYETLQHSDDFSRLESND